MSGSASSPDGADGAGRAAAVRGAVSSFVDGLPAARRIVTELVRVEFLDRSMVIAAQALFSVTPLLVVFAAFAPRRLNANLLEQVTGVLGIEGDDGAALDTAATVANVQTRTGVLGIVLVVVSSLSFARAVQRLYERVWARKHRGGLVGYRRRLWWLIWWIACLELAAAVVNALAGSDTSVFRLALQIVISTGIWWWTAHTLLLGTVSWRLLGLGAFLTASGVTVVLLLSRQVMPEYVAASVDQFGGIGLMLAASTWLLVLGGVLVLGAVLGRVVIEEPRLRPLRKRASRTGAASAGAAGEGRA